MTPCAWCGGPFKKVTGQKYDKPELRTARELPWTVDEMGYRRRLINGRLKYEHRYVMELHLGRPLGRREQVHHIDGDRANNAIENLVLMMLGDHQRFHGRKKADALGKSHKGPKE